MVILLNIVKLCQKVLIFFSADKNNQIRIINLIKADIYTNNLEKNQDLLTRRFSILLILSHPYTFSLGSYS